MPKYGPIGTHRPHITRRLSPDTIQILVCNALLGLGIAADEFYHPPTLPHDIHFSRASSPDVIEIIRRPTGKDLKSILVTPNEGSFSSHGEYGDPIPP